MQKIVIHNLLTALQEIEPAHYLTPNIRMVEDVCNVFGDGFTTYENNFTGQLSTHYAILAKTGQTNEPQGFLRQLQIPKHYVYSEDRDNLVALTVEKLRDIPGNGENELSELLTIPDFIIHKHQENSEIENQLLILEVKTEANLSYAKFAWDFFKLNLYLNKFNFQTACFLVVNNSKEAIYSYVSRYLNEKLYRANRPSDLFVIVKESYNGEPRTTTLNRLWKIYSSKF